MAGDFSIKNTSLDEKKELMESITFFQKFPAEVLDEVLNKIQVIEAEPGAEILSQGEINDSLYFLLNGLVTVIVDGGVVAKLRRRGDIIGEMSVLSDEPVTASIVSDTPVQLLRLRAEDLTTIQAPGSGEAFQVLLYQRYAVSLTEKLRKTNHKAKVVEEMNHALEEAKNRLENVNARLEIKVAERTKDLQQKAIDLLHSHQKLENKNAELIASHRKMEEVFKSQERTFARLDHVYEDRILPLKSTLTSLQSIVTEPEQVSNLNKAILETDELEKMIKPIIERFQLEKSIESKKVLLAEPVKKQQIIAKMALQGSGVDLDIVSSIEGGLKKVLANSYDVIFVDLSLIELAEKSFDKNPMTKFVFMTGEDIKSYLPVLQQAKFFPNIVSRNAEDRAFTIKNIMTTVTKLISNEIFGLEKYLSWGVDVQEATITDSRNRGNLINLMDSYFAEMGVRRSTRDSCKTVVEELLMNAIYDAPLDISGKPKYNHLDRSNHIVLEEGERAKMRYASDGVLMAVSVEDPFGALSQRIVLNYLETCYGEKAGSLNQEKGGAGRGLHQIIEGSDLVVFNVSEGRRTEVIALFETAPAKGAEKRPSFHFFHI